SAGGSSGGAKSDINVTPLVDVCLVLLIIFMVMVPRNVPEISVRIPPESKVKKTPPPDAQPLVIGLSDEGAITLNRNPIEEQSLGDELAKQLEVRDTKAVFVDFDDKAKYGRAIELIELAKKSGAEVVGIMKRKDETISDNLKAL